MFETLVNVITQATPVGLAYTRNKLPGLKFTINTTWLDFKGDAHDFNSTQEVIQILNECIKYFPHVFVDLYAQAANQLLHTPTGQLQVVEALLGQGMDMYSAELDDQGEWGPIPEEEYAQVIADVRANTYQNIEEGKFLVDVPDVTTNEFILV